MSESADSTVGEILEEGGVVGDMREGGRGWFRQVVVVWPFFLARRGSHRGEFIDGVLALDDPDIPQFCGSRCSSSFTMCNRFK